MTKEVCVILPALNEEDTIGMVIDEIPVEEIERNHQVLLDFLDDLKL